MKVINSATNHHDSQIKINTITYRICILDINEFSRTCNSKQKVDTIFYQILLEFNVPH